MAHLLSRYKEGFKTRFLKLLIILMIWTKKSHFLNDSLAKNKKLVNAQNESENNIYRNLRLKTELIIKAFAGPLSPAPQKKN